jgi:anti-sigma-K factor RskA
MSESDDNLTPEELRQIEVAEYVLGVQDAGARAAFERRLEDEPDLAKDITFWETRLGALVGNVKPVAPPEAAWTKIESQLGSVTAAARKAAAEAEARKAAVAKAEAAARKAADAARKAAAAEAEAAARREAAAAAAAQKAAAAEAEAAVRKQAAEEAAARKAAEAAAGMARKNEVAAAEAAAHKAQAVASASAAASSLTATRADAIAGPGPAPARSAPIKPRTGLWRSLAFWRSFALLSAVVASGCIAMLVRGGGLSQPPGSSHRPLLATLGQTSGQPGFVAAIGSDGRNLTIMPASPLTADQRSMELWLIPAGDRPYSLGLIAAGRPVRITIPPALIPHVAANTSLSVTLEPPGGSPTGEPTGAVIANGQLTNL